MKYSLTRELQRNPLVVAHAGKTGFKMRPQEALNQHPHYSQESGQPCKIILSFLAFGQYPLRLEVQGEG